MRVINVMNTVPLDGPVTDRLTAAKRFLAAALEMRQATLHACAAIKDDDSLSQSHKRAIGRRLNEAYGTVQMAEQELDYAQWLVNQTHEE
jgi:hypothetical protein